MNLEEFIDEYVTKADHPLYESNVARLTREDDTEDALAELAQLRARIAAAEAVIAALPRCEACSDQAMWKSRLECGGLVCDDITAWQTFLAEHGELPYAAPLRAYLAFVEAQR